MESPDTKLYRTFVKGLITEASELTFPENASYDEDNCLLYRRGNRSRRLGLDYEDNFEYFSYSLTISNGISTEGLSEFIWEEVAGEEGRNFLVHQVGDTIHFFDLSSNPISGNEKAFTIDLSDYIAPSANATLAQSSPVSMASARGHLFLASKYYEPLMVEYDPDEDDITVTEIILQVRDLEGIDDGLANDEEPPTLSIQHNYNLQNQGWIDPSNSPDTGKTVTYFPRLSATPETYHPPTTTLITTFFNDIGRYPSNSQQWYLGKKGTDQDFEPTHLHTVSFGNASAPRGHYILNAMHKDRSAVSGISGLDVELIKTRPISITSVAGRLWYLCEDTIYFTQLLDDELTNVGRCYQEADPTSETINDLIATDGGTIPLPDVGVGQRLIASSGGILVFGSKGVSFIHGTDQGFSATAFEITKVSPVGTDSPYSIVETADTIIWMSKVGIQVLKQENGVFAFADPTHSNLSLKRSKPFSSRKSQVRLVRISREFMTLRIISFNGYLRVIQS
jgi:hypothetical protein